MKNGAPCSAPLPLGRHDRTQVRDPRFFSEVGGRSCFVQTIFWSQAAGRTSTPEAGQGARVLRKGREGRGGARPRPGRDLRPGQRGEPTPRPPAAGGNRAGPVHGRTLGTQARAGRPASHGLAWPRLGSPLGSLLPAAGPLPVPFRPCAYAVPERGRRRNSRAPRHLRRGGLLLGGCSRPRQDWAGASSHCTGAPRPWSRARGTARAGGR